MSGWPAGAGAIEEAAEVCGHGRSGQGRPQCAWALAGDRSQACQERREDWAAGEVFSAQLRVGDRDDVLVT